jgi:hypothetical protein
MSFTHVTVTGMDWQDHSLCPRCGVGRLRSWQELDTEERELARRLPASAEYKLSERRAAHRWCRRCWYEATSEGETVA